MELVLGTAQFGLAYGVAGRSAPLSDAEARAVLAAAAARGVRWLDTAPAYGDIEQRLASLCGDLPFEIVSKLPALPTDARGQGAADLVVAAVRRSRARLGSRLKVLLFHRAEDLLREDAELLWRAVSRQADDEGIHIGVSCYQLDTLREIQTRWPVQAAQLPGNALDQALRSLNPAEAPPLVQSRSAFLQGLLVMPEDQAVRRLPAASQALQRWHAWCRSRSMDPLSAALAVVKGFSAVGQCVVGVDNLSHFEQIASAWEHCTPAVEPGLACSDLSVTDPRQWRIAS
jgi:aryl-alcohol dehydrogenase-like predicted oxidoreductase